MQYIRRFGEPKAFAKEIGERLGKKKIKCSPYTNGRNEEDLEILSVKINNVKLNLRISGNVIEVSKKITGDTKPVILKNISVDTVKTEDEYGHRQQYVVYEKYVHLAKNKKMHKNQLFMDACGLVTDVYKAYSL